MKYLGKLAGAFVGLAGGFGLFGIILGIILGHLADQLIQLYRMRRKLARFYSDPLSFPLDISETKIAGMVGIFYTFHVNPLSSYSGTIQSVLAKQQLILAFKPLPGISPSFLTMCIDACLGTEEPADLAAFAQVYKSVTNQEERLSFLQFLIITAVGQDIEVLDTRLENLRPLSGLLNIDERDFAEIAAGAGLHKDTLQQDCALLGVLPEADLGEVKRTYRRLAAQFHPDSAATLNPGQRRQLSETFIQIHGAYLRILKSKVE